MVVPPITPRRYYTGRAHTPSNIGHNARPCQSSASAKTGDSGRLSKQVDRLGTVVAQKWDVRREWCLEDRPHGGKAVRWSATDLLEYSLALVALGHEVVVACPSSAADPAGLPPALTVLVRAWWSAGRGTPFPSTVLAHRLVTMNEAGPDRGA